jgi:cbb3-type cytochrome oxidase subunit 3
VAEGAMALMTDLAVLVFAAFIAYAFWRSGRR